MVCPGCQTPHVAAAAYCGQCGRKLSSGENLGRRNSDLSPLALLAIDWPDALSIHMAAHVLGMWGGTIESSQEGQILAAFGRPYPREDDLRRAAAAALDLMARRSACEVREPRAWLCHGSLPRRILSLAETTMGQEALVRLAGLPEGRIGMPLRTARLMEANFDVEPAAEEEFSWLLPGQRRLDPHRVSPLYGRTAERRKLAGMLAACVDGHPQVWVLTGPEGAGKSRLVVEAQAEAQRDSLSRLLLVRVHSLSPDRDFGLVRDLIDQILADPDQGTPWPNAAAFGKQWPDTHAEFLWPLLSGLSRTESPSIEQIQQLLPHLSNFLWDASRHRLVVLAVDNIEWTDAYSWAWWQQFLQTTPSAGHRLWVILTSTQRFVLPETGLDLTVTHLPPLGEDEALACLAGAMGLDAHRETWTPDLRTVLQENVRHAGGNPLFLRELAFDLLASGTVRYGGDGWTVLQGISGSSLVPESLSILLQSKEARLPPAARHALATAAVIGSRVAWEDLEDLLGREEMPDLVQTLVDAGLLSVEGQEVCFRQEALRTLTAAGWTPEQRQAVKRQLAMKLVDRHQEHLEKVQDRVADLLEEGAAYGEALEWAHRAMALAHDRKQGSEALRRAHQILRLLRSLPDSQTDALHAAQGDVARLELQFGSVSEAEHLWQSLHDVLPIAKRHESRTQLARIAGLRGDFAKAMAFAEEGLSVAELLGETGQQAKFLIEVGLLAARQERWDVAKSAARRADFVLHSDPHGLTAADLLRLQGKVRLWEGLPEEALVAGRNALEIYESLREPDALGETLMLLAEAHRKNGNLTLAQRSLRQALQVTLEPAGLREIACLIGRLALEEGDAPTVLELAEHFRSALADRKIVQEQLLLAVAWLFAGMRDTLLRELPSPFEGAAADLAVLHAVVGIACAEADEGTGADLSVRQALESASSAPTEAHLARALAWGSAGHVAFVQGKYETALEHLAEACNLVAQAEHPTWAMWFDIMRALSLKTLGRPSHVSLEDLALRASRIRIPIPLEPYWTFLRQEQQAGDVGAGEAFAPLATFDAFEAWDDSMPAWTSGND